MKIKVRGEIYVRHGKQTQNGVSIKQIFEKINNINEIPNNSNLGKQK